MLFQSIHSRKKLVPLLSKFISWRFPVSVHNAPTVLTTTIKMMKTIQKAMMKMTTTVFSTVTTRETAALHTIVTQTTMMMKLTILRMTTMRRNFIRTTYLTHDYRAAPVHLVQDIHVFHRTMLDVRYRYRDHRDSFIRERLQSVY